MTRGIPATLLHRPRRKFPADPEPTSASPVEAPPVETPVPEVEVAPVEVAVPEEAPVEVAPVEEEATPAPVEEEAPADGKPAVSATSSRKELLAVAKKLGISVSENMKKSDILALIENA